MFFANLNEVGNDEFYPRQRFMATVFQNKIKILIKYIKFCITFISFNKIEINSSDDRHFAIKLHKKAKKL